MAKCTWAAVKGNRRPHTASSSVANSDQATAKVTRWPWLPKERILFTGDLCVNWGFGNNVADADADYDNWLRALDTMASMNPAIVVVGDGDLGGAQVLSAQKAYLGDMLGQVRKGVKAGKTADQLATEINLMRHKIGADKERNVSSVRAMYGKVARP